VLSKRTQVVEVEKRSKLQANGCVVRLASVAENVKMTVEKFSFPGPAAGGRVNFLFSDTDHSCLFSFVFLL